MLFASFKRSVLAKGTPDELAKFLDEHYGQMGNDHEDEFRQQLQTIMSVSSYEGYYEFMEAPLKDNDELQA